MSTDAVSRTLASRRRSPRIALLTKVHVSSNDAGTSSFSQLAKATSLNKHGAAIQLNRQLPIGSMIKVKNRAGVEAPARIVAQVGVANNAFVYGVEFVQGKAKPDFWGVTFPTTE
jgi:PilZ domain